MKLEIADRLFKTNPRHSDMVDSFAYMIASQEAKLLDEYVLLHLRKKPWYMPEFVYKWLIKKIVFIDRFKN